METGLPPLEQYSLVIWHNTNMYGHMDNRLDFKIFIFISTGADGGSCMRDLPLSPPSTPVETFGARIWEGEAKKLKRF